MIAKAMDKKGIIRIQRRDCIIGICMFVWPQHFLGKTQKKGSSNGRAKKNEIKGYNKKFFFP